MKKIKKNYFTIVYDKLSRDNIKKTKKTKKRGKYERYSSN